MIAGNQIMIFTVSTRQTQQIYLKNPNLKSANYSQRLFRANFGI